MLGARIDVVEAPIWHFKAYLMPLPDKKTDDSRAATNDYFYFD